MEILDLKQRPDVLSLLADWHQSEWAYLNPGQTLDDRIKKMQAYLNDDFIPSTFVAIDKEVLGSAAIVTCDMEERKKYSPWLASVFVNESNRCRGVGTNLIKFIMRQAKEQGYMALYLYTIGQQKFYQQLGWEPIETRQYHGISVTIMSVSLKEFEEK